MTCGTWSAIRPAASLLPGLLAATRTGLTPAGDDELMSDHDHIIDLRLWAHSEDLCRERYNGATATAISSPRPHQEEPSA
jgi:hypothetical protein